MSSICDERGAELLYAGVPITKIFEVSICSAQISFHSFVIITLLRQHIWFTVSHFRKNSNYFVRIEQRKEAGVNLLQGGAGGGGSNTVVTSQARLHELANVLTTVTLASMAGGRCT